MDPDRRSLVFVEDRAAREFLQLVLRQYDRVLASEVVIIDVGGEGNISTALGLIPSRMKHLKIAGVYDADMKGKVLANSVWHTDFLPCSQSIELEFQKIVSEYVKEVADILGLSEEAVCIADARHRGSNEHDWFENYQQEVGMHYDQFMYSLFTVWCSLESNATSCQKLVKRLSTCLG
jgi:hypothetical protein